MGGYVNKEVCVNIELFLLVFVHEKKSASCIRSSRMNVLWFLMDFCQVSYRCGLLKVGKFGPEAGTPPEILRERYTSW